MSLNAAVIGIGRKGFRGAFIEGLYKPELTHVGAVLKTQGLNLVAVCDKEQARLNEFDPWMKLRSEGPLDVAQYIDYQDMMNQMKPDVVSIATPVETHAGNARNVMRFGCVKAILLEKPIAESVDKAKSIVDDSKNFNVPVIINHTRRWQAAWKSAAYRIRNLGGAYHIVGRCNGETLDAGVHMTDLFRWLGPKAKHTYVDLYDPGLGKYQPYLLFELEAYCPKGLVRVSGNGQSVSEARPEETKRYRDLKELRWWGCGFKDFPDDMGAATLKAFAELRDLVLGKRKRPTCSSEDGLKALELCSRWVPSVITYGHRDILPELGRLVGK